MADVHPFLRWYPGLRWASWRSMASAALIQINAISGESGELANPSPRQHPPDLAVPNL
jgi:hypothetical protein